MDRVVIKLDYDPLQPVLCQLPQFLPTVRLEAGSTLRTACLVMTLNRGEGVNLGAVLCDILSDAPVFGGRNTLRISRGLKVCTVSANSDTRVEWPAEYGMALAQAMKF